MEGFTYHNIFDTKGIEYLAIIAFFLILIPFWILLNKPMAAMVSVRKAVGLLSDTLLRIPKGILLSRNHLWAFREKSGLASIGADDFLMHIIGDVSVKQLCKPGDKIRKGDPVAELDHGGKRLQLFSPISGEIAEINQKLSVDPTIIHFDPYEKGWMLRIFPTNWNTETQPLYIADDAVTWLKKELVRFKDFIAESTNQDARQMILQDGGEPRVNIMTELPEDVWKEFQERFLEIRGG